MYISKHPDTWTKMDLHNAALMIKNHPEDMELKEQFFNIIPESGEGFNHQLYLIIKAAYDIHIRNKGLRFEKDDFTSITIYYLYTHNFSDWNPMYSLSTYLHMLFRSNGPLGYKISEEIKTQTATISIDQEFEENPNANIPSLITPDFTESLNNEQNLEQLLETLLPILHLTRDELTLYLVINHRVINDNTLFSVNNLLGTKFTRQELQRLCYRITRKIKLYMPRAAAYLKIWKNKQR